MIYKNKELLMQACNILMREHYYYNYTRLMYKYLLNCGNEDWQMLPFCLDAQSGIVSDCENAKEYRKLIGLQI